MIFKKSRIIKFSFCLWLFFLLASCGTIRSLKDIPSITGYNTNIPERVKVSESNFKYKNNSLLKNKYGLWELYVEGDAFQRGLITGSLTQELLINQEKIFLSKIDELVSSKTKRRFLRIFLAWFNRKMYLNIPLEYKVEIFGLSKYFSNNYNYIAKPYLRALYLHGAHDIGHALQDLALVGCSSFAAWGEKTYDGSLVIGRNFDFFVGDEFSKEKIIAFINPTKGHKYMSVTWGGMLGVVSGMNEHGLTVTINAGKSKIPLIAKTPVSILTKEILQYASTIDEAITIAKKRKVFVSESILIGSSKDKRAITIEVSPKNFGVFEVTNSTQLICSNHFQSLAYKEDKHNLKHIEESHSEYRYKRMEELLEQNKKLTPEGTVNILRNKEGLNNKFIGYGNEKALNQLLAHHSIVFKPEQLIFWVSSNPYQLGEYVAYDLNTIFDNSHSDTSFFQPKLTIEKDTFQYTKAYMDYEAYRELSLQVKNKILAKETIMSTTLKTLQTLNPNYWEAYYLTGKYYYDKKFYTLALNEFNIARTKEITTVQDQREIDFYVKKLKRKLKRKLNK